MSRLNAQLARLLAPLSAVIGRLAAAAGNLLLTVLPEPLSDRLSNWWAGLTSEERWIALSAVGAVVLLWVALAVGSIQIAFVLSLLASAGMYILLTMGLNVQWGYGGLVNFSVVAFWGIGAYSAALMTSSRAPTPLELNPITGVLLAIVVSTVLAIVIAYPTLRLRADYLAIATLGFSEIIRIIILNEGWLTGGGLGVPAIPSVPTAIPGLDEAAELLGVTPRAIVEVIIAAILVLIMFALLRRIQVSPWGRVLRSIRADEDLAQAVGKDSFRFKLQAFVLGCIIMALAGVFYAHMNRHIEPGDLDPIQTFYIWVALIIGGTGSNRGAILGGFMVVLILQGSRFLNDFFAGLGDLVGLLSFLAEIDLHALRLVLIGLLVILVVRLRPQGLLPPQREHIWPSARRAHDGGDQS